MEQLKAVVETEWQAWQAIAATIGVSEEEQRQENAKLMQRVAALLADQIAARTRERDTLQAALQQHHADIRSVCAQLNIEQPSVADVGGLIEREQVARKALETLQTQKQAQEQKIATLLKELRSRRDVLGEAVEPELASSEDLSDARITVLQQHIAAAKSEMHAREQKLLTLMKAINALLTELKVEEKERSALDQKCTRFELDQLGLKKNVIADCEQRHEQLLKLKEARELRFKRVAAEVLVLWNELEVCDAERATFFAEQSGPDVMFNIRACEKEIIRLKKLAEASLKDKIGRARDRLTVVWNLSLTGEAERKAFKPAFTDIVSQEILDSILAQVVIQEAKYEQMKPILELIHEKNTVLQEKERFELTSTDPERFKKPLQLLEEEKFRKRLKQLPLVNKKLRELIPAYETTYGPLLVNGSPYMQILQGEQMREQKEHEEKKKRVEDRKLYRNTLTVAPTGRQSVAPPAKLRSAATTDSLSNTLRSTAGAPAALAKKGGPAQLLPPRRGSAAVAKKENTESAVNAPPRKASAHTEKPLGVFRPAPAVSKGQQQQDEHTPEKPEAPANLQQPDGFISLANL